MSRYAQALERQRRYARWLASPRGVEEFYDQSPDQVMMRSFYATARLTLASADPYYWAPEMCGLLEEVSAAMPPWTLRREALPTDYGFCWFEAPLRLPNPSLAIEAIAWGVARGAAPAASDGRSVLLTGYAREQQRPEEVWPVLSVSWPFGMARTADDVVAETDVALKRRTGQRVWQLLAGVFALLEQKILVAAPAGIDRAARRRLAKSKARTPPAILVVRLRHAAREGDDAAGHPVAWSCRWIVRGHWRQQYYPSTGEYRPVFILPYIKGPDEMPLRAPAERVFAVVR